MKKLLTKLVVIMLAITLSVGFAGGENDFNWAQWYDWNGMASVVSMVKDGSMTAQEACDTIIIPAHQAGFVEEKQVEAFLKRYPDMKSYLITLQRPQQNLPLPYPNTLSKNAICINTQPQMSISELNQVPMQEKLVTYLKTKKFM